MKRLFALFAIACAVCIIAVGCDAPQPAAQGGGQAPSAPPAPPPPPGWEAPAPPPAAEQPATQPQSAATAETADARPAALPVESKVGVFAGGLDDLAAGPRSSSPPAASPTTSPDPDTELVKAKKGVGIKGRSLDEYKGPIVTPVKALFSTKERVVFEIQVPQAISLYDAANGAPPQSHEEFMEGCIKANNIKLPELPPGHEYWYDAQAKELMVKRPRMP